MCCLTLLGGATVSSSAVVINMKSQDITQWIISLGGKITQFFQNEPSVPAPTSSPPDVIGTLTQAYTATKDFVSSAYSFIVLPALDLGKLLKVFKVVKNFLFSFFDRKIYSELFTRLDIKVKNLFQLIISEEQRNKLFKLFSSENLQKTREITGTLIGMPLQENKFLSVTENLFSYFLLRLVDDLERASSFQSFASEMEKKKDYFAGKKGKYKNNNLQQNFPTYSLNPEWIDCVLGAPSLWWYCSNNNIATKGRGSLISDSLSNFFDTTTL